MRPTTLPFYCLMLASLVFGCESNSGSPRTQAANIDATGGQSLSSDQAVLSDPCAAQLHDISGAMLLYYALHKELPAKLEDVSPLAEADTRLVFTCPVSHQPYLYAPNGLYLAGRDKRIVVYDPAPSHDGNRWCILLAPPAKPKGAVSLDVVEIPEAVFSSYQPLTDPNQ